MAKIVVGGTTASPTYTKTTTSIGDSLSLAVKAPFAVTKDQDTVTEFYGEDDVAVVALAWAFGGFFLGDRFGHKVPYIGQGR